MNRTLIAGIGNVHGDVAFGVEVVRQMGKTSLPEGVAVKDFGMRSYDLAYAIAGEYETVILVDATVRGGKPGTLYVLELDLEDLELGHGALNGHSLNLVSVLQLVRSSQATVGRLYLLGCEPRASEDADDERTLSPEVAAAVPEAIGTIRLLLNNLIEADSRARSKPAPAESTLQEAAPCPSYGTVVRRWQQGPFHSVS